MKKLFLILLLSAGAVFANGVFDPDIEIKVKGLVCPSCAIGIKNGLKKTKLVKVIKFDTKKQLALVEYFSIEIHPYLGVVNFNFDEFCTDAKLRLTVFERVLNLGDWSSPRRDMTHLCEGPKFGGRGRPLRVLNSPSYYL